MDSPGRDHWVNHARQWALVKPPLRPCAEDAAFVEQQATRWMAEWSRDPVVLVLGVTPELCSIPLNGNSRIISVDKSRDMIDAWWRPRRGTRDAVVQADWQNLPLESQSVDLVLADGSLCLVNFPETHCGVLCEIRRVLKPGGRAIFRWFTCPNPPECEQAVYEDLRAGRITSIHVLKWRLAMALQQTATQGVPVCNVWDSLHQQFESLERLAEQFRWPIEEVRTLHAYQGVPTRYFFPTFEQHQAIFAEAGFVLHACKHPTYELGERCPSVRFDLR